MADKKGFREKLSGIMELAAEKNNRISAEEVERYFEEENLSEEQMDLVYDYLLSQKVAVPGYEKQPGTIRAKEKNPEGRTPLTGEEQAYLENYRRELEGMEAAGGQADMCRYLSRIADEALEMERGGVFLGDVIQEGNAGLIAILADEPGDMTGDKADWLMREVKAEMQAFISAQSEMKQRDQKMAGKVAELDEAIRRLNEEFGRKVTVDEAAGELNMTEEEILDVLRLAGEDIKEEEE